MSVHLVRRPRLGPLGRLVLLGGLMWAAPAAAIYNPLAYVDAVTRDGWYHDLDLGGRLQRGNVESTTIDGGYLGAWRRDRDLLFWTGSGRYGTAGGETFASESLAHLRYRRFVGRGWAWEFFAQHEYNAFQRIAQRILAGGGPRWGTHGAWGHLAVGLAAMYEWLQSLPGTPGTRVRDTGRLSSYLLLGWRLGDLHVEAVGFVQPRFAVPEDLRATAQLDLVVPLADHFELRLYGNVAYDATPLAEVETTDAETGVRLRWRLRPSPGGRR